MKFRISGLPVAEFAAILRLDDAALDRAGIRRCTVDEANAFPCRITLEDAAPGEQVLLLSYAHLASSGPYASSGPIFIRRSARATCVAIDEVPAQQRRRLSGRSRRLKSP